MADIRIDDIRRQLEDISLKSKSTTDNANKTGDSFSSYFKDALNETNSQQLKAEESVQNYVSGKETNLHNTLISLEKADLSFKMMMQVRSKLMDAYQQIMRTSV
ncbi:MAG: flagellar hook-basal body complex protein FliE [bacterium]|nr:flagellar hook-basal body complex protein FliE [bacterium]